MCIIVSKEKGIDMPSKDVLKNCFEINSDGAGIMYTNKGNVCIEKGFDTFEKFWAMIEKLERKFNLTDLPLVMHFRISTSGKVDGGNCHPFPVAPDKKNLRAKHVITDLGMAHNGVIYNYDKDPKKELNDTQCFIRDVVSVLKRLNNDFLEDKKVLSMLEDIAESKLCFMDKNGKITYIGDYIEDNGVMYSNSSYLPKVYYSRIYNDNYGYGYYGLEESQYYLTYSVDDIIEKVYLGHDLTPEEIGFIDDFLEPLYSNAEIYISDCYGGERYLYQIPEHNAFEGYYIGDYEEVIHINRTTGESEIIGYDCCYAEFKDESQCRN